MLILCMEDNLQRYKNIRINLAMLYNMEVLTTKSKVMAFQDNNIGRVKIVNKNEEINS
jgi:hypothetical protein